LGKIEEELKELEGFGNKSIENLLGEIENSKKNSLEKLLFGLGIRYVGKKTSKILAKYYKKMDYLFEAPYEELESISDIGEKIAGSVYEYFHKEENINLIQKLQKYGLNMEYLGNDQELSAI